MADATYSPTIMFYKATRPQAPVRHKSNQLLVDKVECSHCRGLFFYDTKFAKRFHRAWHEAHPGQTMTCTVANKLVRDETHYVSALMHTIVPTPDGTAFHFLFQCSACDEDLCPCSECKNIHHAECDRWQAVRELENEGEDEEAEELTEIILAARAMAQIHTSGRNL